MTAAGSNAAATGLYAGGAEPTPEDRGEELARARRLAERYGMELVDLEEFQIDHDLFRAIPADLMLRYGFVPHHREGRSLVVLADYVAPPGVLPSAE